MKDKKKNSRKNEICLIGYLKFIKDVFFIRVLMFVYLFRLINYVLFCE